MDMLMYIILAKVEVVKKVIGPFMTKDSATAARKELIKNSDMRYVVRQVEQTSLQDSSENMETLWKDD